MTRSGGSDAYDSVRRMAGGFSATQILHTAVTLGIADRLSKGARSAEALASDVHAESRALHRFLRMMVALQLLVQDGDAFALSPAGELLRSDHPESLRDRILFVGEINYPTAHGMLHAVRTGEPAFDHIFGTSLFEHLARNPQLSTTFNDILADDMQDRIAGIVAAYPFAEAGTVVDVGGGNGALLAAVLDAAPRVRGIVFDLPSVASEARATFARGNAAGRAEVIEGDFFVDPLPPNADLYLCSNIIHDWDDRRAEQILRNCRAAAGPGSKLLLVEELMPERVADAPATVGLDFSMLLLTGGAQRTESEYRTLLTRCGFRLDAVIPFAPARDHGRKSNWAILENTPSDPQ